jgi:CRP/FNR family cyclic AMP-dependent transcriptional regulator
MLAKSLNVIRCGECSHLSSCIFSELSEKELSQATQSLHLIKCEPSGTRQDTEILVMPGYYIICAGKGTVVTTIPEGKRLVTQILGGGDGLVVSPHWTGGRYNIYMRVWGKALVKFIKEEDFHKLLRKHPAIALRVMEKFDDYVRALQGKLIETAYAGTKARVAALILELEEINLLKEKRFSQEELAEMVGVSREMLNRRLREFVKRGLISLKHHQITVLNLEGLQRAVV